MITNYLEVHIDLQFVRCKLRMIQPVSIEFCHQNQVRNVLIFESKKTELEVGS
jgi:hypothetical protein